MTARERAIAVLRPHFIRGQTGPDCPSVDEVEAAITAAEQAERERCAGIAEQVAESDPHNHCYEGGHEIARRIRSGK
jgi:hypothetical protein